MSIMLITPKTEKVIRMFRGEPRYVISGLKSFCSGSLLSGISAHHLSCTPYQAWTGGRLPVAMPYKECKTMAEWLQYYKGEIYGLPKMYMYWYIMEVVLIKADEGIGGLLEGDYRCYAGNTYATKTWFMADKKSESKSLCTQGFMQFVKDLGTYKTGQILMSPWAKGAHGGHCRGAVWKPNIRRMKEQRNRLLYNMNAHAQYCANELGTSETPLSTDNVCNHW